MAATTPDLSGGPVLLSVSLGTACFALATTFVRFCVRAGINKHIGVDDYASAVATVVALVGTIFGIIEATASDPARAMEFEILGQPWYLMSDTMSKISICLLFILLLRGTRGARQWRILLSVLIFFMAAVNFSFALTVNLQCRPLEKLWNPAVVGACWDPSVQLNFGYFQGAFSVFSWFFLALFPILIGRDLRRDGGPSWPFYTSSVLGFACGIFSITRTAEAAMVGGIRVYTFNAFCASLMSNLEQNVGLIAANVLTLGPLFSSQVKSYLNGTTSSTSASSSRSRRKAKDTTSRAGSTRPITRASSRASSTRHSESEIDLKRTTHLIIQGPRQPDGQGSFLRAEEEEYDLGDGHGRARGNSLDYDSLDLEAWPRGIIKTVSVEVVEEHNPDHHPTHQSEMDRLRSTSQRNSGASAVEQDWEAMLRAGPPAR
ncbi:hypothetical protein B0H66DRAFT_317070 [Apodospora peruviana]|uniref:Rhodopsin domain-containing protein n=1 Tax=Apodospora peruviana TaxID=516989 RepID=A0AAE0HZ88_9PEZI|nr:hypothetical protein B0H66DRAFT_317070 [Apodospora peruviana]